METTPVAFNNFCSKIFLGECFCFSLSVWMCSTLAGKHVFSCHFFLCYYPAAAQLKCFSGTTVVIKCLIAAVPLCSCAQVVSLRPGRASWSVWTSWRSSLPWITLTATRRWFPTQPWPMTSRGSTCLMGSRRHAEVWLTLGLHISWEPMSVFPFIFLCHILSTSVRPAGSRGGCRLRSLSQLVGQRRSVHLQRPGGPSHPDQLETPVSGQQGHVLHQPLPGVHRHRQGHSGRRHLL